MRVACYGSEFEIPDVLIDKYIKDFEGLPGSGQRESIMQLRMSIDDIFDYVAEEPEMLNEYEIRSDFVKALAMQKAMGELGLLHDA
jgi:hypothetical protein